MKKNNYFYVFGLLAFALSGCTNKELYNPNYANEEKVAKSNSFDFATTTTTSVSIQYYTGVSAFVKFDIYEQNPITSSDGSTYTKDVKIQPLYSGYTDADGLFKGSIVLPTYLSKVYVYTPAFYATQILEGTINNGVLSITDTQNTTSSLATRTVETNTGNYQSKAINEDGWHDLLGTYNGTSGKINYTLPGSNALAMSKSDATSLYTAFSNLTSIKPYVSESDLTLQEDAEVAITILGGNSCWNSSLGYYYYKEGNAPANYDAIKNQVILIVPNTQDGGWNIGAGAHFPWYKKVNQDRIGIDRGENIQLKYFGEYKNNKFEKSEGVTQFPKGLKIGFILAVNAWSNRLDGWNSDRPQRSATSMSASRGCNKNGNNYKISPVDVAKTAVYRQGNYVMISFEDDGGANDTGKYTDVVFTTKTNPANAFDVKELETTVTESEVEQGLYCFEDLWPSKGDYDMNDAMAVYTHGSQTTLYTTTTATTSNVSHTSAEVDNVGPYLTGESFIFKTYRNYASLNNKLGFKIINPIGDLSKATITMSQKSGTDVDGNDVFTEAAFTREGNNIFLLGGISKNGENIYKVSINWSESTLDANSLSKIDCFLYRVGDKRWEVHIPFAAPSADNSMVDYSFFGLEDDYTDTTWNKNNWYTSKGVYPFAFFLSGSETNAVVDKLLESDNESKSIDTIYPHFLDWSKSKGTSYQNWYKE